jgi:uncharacterized protein
MRTIRPLKFVLAAVLFVVASSFCHAQASLAGEWEGVLEVGGNEIHLAWHVTAAPDGTVTTTFDNKEEGVMGIKAKVTEFKDSKITVTVDDQVDMNGQTMQIRGTLVGTVSADGNEVAGTWTQTDPQEEPPVDLRLKRTGAPAAPAPATPKG